MSLSFSKLKSEKFFNAARAGNLPLVKSLSLDPEVDLNWQGHNSRTPFFAACNSGHVDIVRYMLDFHGNEKRAIDFNMLDADSWTPFSSACVNCHIQVVEMMLDDERIDVNLPARGGYPPLWWATRRGHVEVVKKMMASTGRMKFWEEDVEDAIELGKSTKGLLETEEAFEFRKKGCLLIAVLIESYLLDPQAVKEQLRREFGHHGELFALVVYLSDGHLRISEKVEEEEDDERRSNFKRFFELAIKLPLDLQMVLCNRAFGLGDSIIKKSHSEHGFRKFARLNKW